jgi:hypothetical protein
VAAPTINKGALSPKALDTDKITPVNIPGSAAGTTIFLIVCHLVAPNAYDPCRNCCGTALIASCDETITIGKTTKAIVKAPESILFPKPSVLTKTAKPNKPYTIDGVPDRFETFIFINFVIQLFLAYSSKYTAVPKPIGTANNIVNRIIQILPIIPGSIPALFGNLEGKFVKKCLVRNGTPLLTISISKIANTIIAIKVIQNITPWKIEFFIFLYFIYFKLFMLTLPRLLIFVSQARLPHYSLSFLTTNGVGAR